MRRAFAEGRAFARRGLPPCAVAALAVAAAMPFARAEAAAGAKSGNETSVETAVEKPAEQGAGRRTGQDVEQNVERGAAAAAEAATESGSAPRAGTPDATRKPGASHAGAQPAWPESDTVLDLLRADARAAAAQRLGHAQDWLAPSPAGSAPARLSPPGRVSGTDDADRVDVLAIYGIGRTLLADIEVNGAVWRYRQGRPWPLGATEQGPEHRYALVAIDLPCVRLRYRNDVRTACLHTESVHER